MPRLMSRVRVPSPAFRIQTRSTTLRVFLLNSYYINPLSQTLLSDSIAVSAARICLRIERTFHGCTLMHGLKSGSCRFWQRTDLPQAQTRCALKSSAPSGARLKNYADSGSACKLAGVQIIPLPTLANQILARTFFRFRRDFVCVTSRWKVLSGEFRRRPTSLAVKLRKSDRVGRRGLFEPREDFPRLNTYAI